MNFYSQLILLVPIKGENDYEECQEWFRAPLGDFSEVPFNMTPLSLLEIITSLSLPQPPSLTPFYSSRLSLGMALLESLILCFPPSQVRVKCP